MRWRALAVQRRVLEAILEAGAEILCRNSSGKVHAAHDDSHLACFRPRRPFTFPFEENFESYRVGNTPRYFSDQKGTFEVCQSPKGGSCLAQIVPAQGIL